MKHTFPVPQAIQIALNHQKSGNLKQAAGIYRKILDVEPGNAAALHLLGVIGIQTGDFCAAAGLIEKAISVNNTVPEFFGNLGLALQGKGDTGRAVECFKRAIELKPFYADAHNNMGSALHSLGRHEEALASYLRAIEINPDYAEAYYNRGITLKDMGRPLEAIESYKKAIELKPGYAEAYNNMGFIRHEQAAHAEAEACYRKAIELAPGYAEAHNNLGAIFLEQKKTEQAVRSYRRAVELKPGYADAWNNLGFALNALGRRDEAAAAYRSAIAIRPEFADAWNNLGLSLRDMGKPEEALEAHRRAAAIKPDSAAAYNSMGVIYQELGRFGEAIAAHNKAISADGNFAPAYLCLAACKKFGKAESRIIEDIKRLLEREGIKEEETADLRFALGKIYDDLGLHEEAFLNYSAANRIENRKCEFDREKHAAYISGIMEAFTPEFFGRMRATGSDADLPVLIVGMIRSGTTMVEQILASHPRVHGAGELDFWEKTEKKFPLDSIGAITEGMVRSVAEENIDCLRSFSKVAWHVTDKMPGNFQRLGLIHLVFPNARIIHVKRNPVDTCLSIYFHKFAGRHPYGYDLDNLVFYYKQYERLMGHWGSVLPPGIFYELQYEELVEDQEKVSRELVGFCGLPWYEGCLDFHLTKRPVRTCSNWQVRQPLYKSSSGRWKRYEPFLGALAALITGK